MKLQDAINNTKNIYLSDSSLNTLLDFERVLDELDLYAFDHWIDGELVQGPTIERYWITCTFMWPYEKMPDPRGGKRLVPYNCKIFYKKSSIMMPMKINNPDDFRDDGSRKAKLESVPVWYVSIRMPQELVSDIEAGSLEIASEEYDLEDVQYSYQQGLDDQQQLQGDGQTNADQPGASDPAPGSMPAQDVDPLGGM